MPFIVIDQSTFSRHCGSQSLYKNVQYNSEEIALENLKHLTDDIQQRMDHAIAHYIQNLCIQSTIRLPVSESNSVSFGWLKQLIELDGLKNLKALSIKLCAVQAAPDGSIEEFDFTDLWGSIKPLSCFTESRLQWVSTKIRW
ncbi:hypothetical protein BDQ17DRAFT_1419264 [Cyathus striatus]|nr:hypothetical protein BDQ17DRAFT_1419264 [Cyathus striatus]